MTTLNPELVNEINELTTFDECDAVWKLVKARWNEIRDDTVVNERRNHRVGDKVIFKGRSNYSLTGEITKLNPKKAKVFVHDTLESWNVPYSMLNKYEDISKTP